MSLIRLFQNLGHLVVAHYTPEFKPLDASAPTIWPNVPEEIDPPRWRLDSASGMVDPAEANARSSSPRPGERAGILHA